MSDPCGWPMGIHRLQMRCELAWGHEGDHVPVGSAEDPVIAAAEERGRRRGVEEAEALRALLRYVETTLAGQREIEGASPATVSAIVAKLAAYAVHHPALAPRDSGKLPTHNKRAAVHTDKCQAGEYDTECK